MNTRTLTFLPSEENGAEGGAAKARWGRPGIQSKGWQGLGDSALGSRRHLQDTIFPGHPLSPLSPPPSRP